VHDTARAKVFRASLAALAALEPAEQDAIVADLRARRPIAVAPLGLLGPSMEPMSDSRSAP
jgi:hypothetical protein